VIVAQHLISDLKFSAPAINKQDAIYSTQLGIFNPRTTLLEPPESGVGKEVRYRLRDWLVSR
jgi:hypothetical protein